MTDKRLRAASQSSSKSKPPPSNLPPMMFNVQTPSDTAETHQFGAETAELPVQEEKRVTIAFAESIAQQIEQILELENLEEAEANHESERLLSSQP
ncbi:BnaC03g72140D [Brassica napus]|uniref:(rape) hypothetical protein n=1 Tax=Brassica napus TaxID=3708 RepID=A0A078J9X4_BRANA|nr:unnamed protein product [Brassica napus]CDY62431.1 BnaC03g72140D [Brassica napus]